MLGKYRKWIIIALAIIAAFLLYTFFFTGGDDDELLSSSSNVSENANQVIGDQIIQALNQIETLRLNRDIFDSAVFQSLKDRSQEIPPEPVGKANPFDPIGSSVPESDEDAPDIQNDNVSVQQQPQSPNQQTRQRTNTLINTTNIQQPVI